MKRLGVKFVLRCIPSLNYPCTISRFISIFIGQIEADNNKVMVSKRQASTLSKTV